MPKERFFRDIVTLKYKQDNFKKCTADTIKKYKDINEIKDNSGWTALHWAAKEENLEAAILLIKSNASVNEEDNYGRTPLHWAARSGKTEMVKLFLENSADEVVDNLPDSPKTSQKPKTCSGFL